MTTRRADADNMLIRRHARVRLCALLAGTLLGATLPAIAQAPATAPSDAALDFILGAATADASPTTAPSTQPATTDSPFATAVDPAARAGTFTFSDGSVASGVITTTLGKPLRIWVAEQGEFVDVPFASVRSATATVRWERDQPEYQFLTSGSDVKTFTGRTYPARETAYTFALLDGRAVSGSIVAPFDVKAGDGTSRLIVLGKRDKGAVGQALADLVYVTKLELAP
jgi:hypothetical protein